MRVRSGCEEEKVAEETDQARGLELQLEAADDLGRTEGQHKRNDSEREEVVQDSHVQALGIVEISPRRDDADKQVS